MPFRTSRRCRAGDAMASYRLLTDHFVSNQYLEAGSVVSDSGPGAALPRPTGKACRISGTPGHAVSLTLTRVGASAPGGAPDVGRASRSLHLFTTGCR